MTVEPQENVQGLVRAVALRLREAQVDTPVLDAELIVGEVLGLDRVGLRAHGDRSVTERELAAVEAMATRAEAHEPVQYLLGRAPFRTIELRVDSRVLIPRPETELLVELALGDIVGYPNSSWPVRVLDVCTGSGAVAVAVAVEAMPGSVAVTATDLSADALDVAHANAVDQRVDVELLEGDLLVPVAGRTFEVVVANPPYVPRADEHSLAPNVRDHEPHLALFVDGDDPIALARRIAVDVREVLAPGGLVAIEIGMGQHAALADALAGLGYADVATHDDLQGIARVVSARHPA